MAEEIRDKYISYCNSKSINQHPYILWQLEQHTNKSEDACLQLPGNNYFITKTRLNDEDFEALCCALMDTSLFSEINLSYNNCSGKGAQHISKLIENNAALVALDLHQNDIDGEGAKSIAKSLHDNSTLKFLRLSGNKISNYGGMHFAGALQVNLALEVLDLNETDLGMESIIAFSTVLTRNRFMKSVYFNRPLLFSLQEETTIHLSLMLKVNTFLKEIHLAKHNIRDFGAERLAEALAHNSTLKYLNLSCNRITRDGAKHLANLLEVNQALEVLDLGQNRLENEGAIHFAEGLQKNFTLKALSIPDNQIEAEGLCALADALDTNHSLENLYIWGNCLEERACIAFDNLLTRKRLNASGTDVQPYLIDSRVYLAHASHGLRTYYYYKPCFGPDASNYPESLQACSYKSPVPIKTSSKVMVQ